MSQEMMSESGGAMTTVLSGLLIVSVMACSWLGVVSWRLRQRLRESRRVFRTLVNNPLVGVVHTDAAGRRISTNEAWSRMSGLSSDATGDTWHSIVHPDDLPDVIARWENAVRTKQSYLNELRLVRHDGIERTIVAAINPTTDEHGEADGFIGMVLDVSELRDARRKVRDQGALLQDLIDHSSAAIYVKDAAGHYLLANKRHKELWPAMRDFQPGTTPYDWFPEEVARSFEASDRAVWESGETHTFEEAIPADGGERTFVSVKFPIRNEAGSIIAVGGISTDISEQQHARRELAEREQLLRSLIDLQEKERQLICHEFHDGLIQYVVGASMLLERMQADPSLPEACGGTLESVMECLSKGLEDARRVIRGIRPASLDDLGLRAAIDDLASELRADGVEVEMTIDGQLEAVDESLHTAIYRVIQELFHNALKHSGTPRVQLSIHVDPAALELVVQDFGCGFVATLPTEGFGLTGICERVRLAGGTCGLQTAPGEGTRVAIRLPLELPSSPAHRGDAAKT